MSRILPRVRRADEQRFLVLPRHHVCRDPLRLWQQYLLTIVFFPLLGFGSFSTVVLYWLNISLSVLIQTLLVQLLFYLLSSGEVLAVVNVLINVMYLLFAGFNPPAAVIPDCYRSIFDVTSQRCSLSILVSLVFGSYPEDTVYYEVTKGCTTVRSKLAC
uniref:Uncharacterized protein n=1 Tax=Peronospora matthiolae TaxID=2874970 RepID=A0AAV1U377_9STRA